MTEKTIEYQIIKCLHRIATDDQTMEELVSHEKLKTTNKEDAINYMMSKAKPGVHFEILYYPVPVTFYSVLITENGFVDCDDNLNADGDVDKEKVRASIEKAISKELDWEYLEKRQKESK